MAPAPPPAAAAAAEGQQQRQVLLLPAVDITAENFAPFGQARRALTLVDLLLLRLGQPAGGATPEHPSVCPASLARARGPTAPRHLLLQLVGANDDGKEFDEQDAQLDLSQGQPR